MDKRAKKAIARNRVKILALDYFDLTAPLLAADLLPIKKHKEIKTEAPSNKARIDLLLEWIDESAPNDAFQPFLQGIRNCSENVLAKKIKKEAAEGGLEMPIKLVKASAKPVGSGIPVVAIPGTAAAAGIMPTADKKPKAAKPKPTKVKEEPKPESSGLGTMTLPFNGLEALLPTPEVPGAATPQSRKRKSAGAADKTKTPKTPKTEPGAAKSNDADDTKVVSTKNPPTPKTAAKKAAPKIKLPLPTKPPKVTRTSSTEKGGDDQAAKKPTKAPAKKAGAANAVDSEGNGKSPKAAGKAKVMHFREVELKQQDSRQKFRFKNSDAVVKLVHFKDKTDISYLGCPFEENNKMCEKRVELKNKEFVCESRHKSPNCKQIPRLYVTFNDGTADLQLVLMKENVEIFCGRSLAELGSVAINEIKEALDKTVGKNYAVEVHCEKPKKVESGGKKSGIPKWINLAKILLNDEEAPAAKKKRKN